MRIQVILKTQNGEIETHEHTNVMDATKTYTKLRNACIEEGESFNLNMVIELLAESN